MRKKLISLLCAVLITITGFSVVGCRGNIRDDDQFLQILITNYGYGIEWAQPLVDEFLAQGWVKEKYPNVDASIKTTIESSLPTVEAQSNTTYDLLFSTSNIKSNLALNSSGESPYFAELSDVYESKVPNENVTFADKMNDQFLNYSRIEYVNGEGYGYYAVPWISGNQGLLYNATEFEKLSLSVPRTTDELKETADDIVSLGKKAFIFSSQEVYWTIMQFRIWWAQYEGYENYDLFYQGLIKDEDGYYKYSSDIFKQTGRLRSLEVLQELIGVPAGESSNVYNYEYVNTEPFKKAQANFMLGKGLMIPNGDWVENEMREDKIKGGITDEYIIMKNPVISSITEKLEDTSMSDEKLRAVIDAVDNGLSECEGVTEEDFDYIKEARNMMMPTVSHVAFVPEYSSSKELAKDFLRFMATDKANQVFAQYANGATMPFEYDYETKSPDIWEQFSLSQKERLKNAKNAVYLGMENSYKTCYFGGLSPLSLTRRKLEVLLVSQSKADRQTPQQIYDAEIAYWNETRWSNVLSSAGIK